MPTTLMRLTLFYLVGLLFCFTPQQSMCMEEDPKKPLDLPSRSAPPPPRKSMALKKPLGLPSRFAPPLPRKSSPRPPSPSIHHEVAPSSSSSGSSSSSSTVPKDIEAAILSGDPELVQALELPKHQLNAYYQQLQYIVGVQVGKRLPERCYHNEFDHGMFLYTGQFSISRSMYDDELNTHRNLVEEMEAKNIKRSRVKELVTVCGVQMPVTENDHLILRQPTYYSCGASAALMIAYDHKCEYVEKLCHVPSQCTEGVTIFTVNEFLAMACPKFVRDARPIKKKILSTMKPQEMPLNVDYVITYSQHFMILRRVGEDRYILRESFCATEYVLDGEHAEPYLRFSYPVLPVIMKDE